MTWLSLIVVTLTTTTGCVDLSVTPLLGLAADYGSHLPSGFQKIEASNRYRLKSGDKECEVETSTKFLDYDMNPAAMIRFTSAAVAQLRMSAKLEPSVTLEAGFRATINVKNAKERIWVTMLLFGNARNFRTVTISSWGGSEEAHLAMVSSVRKIELQEKMAEPNGASNGSQPIHPETNKTSSAAASHR